MFNWVKCFNLMLFVAWLKQNNVNRPLLCHPSTNQTALISNIKSTNYLYITAKIPISSQSIEQMYSCSQKAGD